MAEKRLSIRLAAIDGKQVEQGLHTLSGDSTAQAVVAYGGSARVHIGRANSVSAASCLLADSAAEYFMVTAGDRVYAKREGDADVPVNVTFCTR